MLLSPALASPARLLPNHASDASRGLESLQRCGKIDHGVKEKEEKNRTFSQLGRSWPLKTFDSSGCGRSGERVRMCFVESQVPTAMDGKRNARFPNGKKRTRA